MRTICARRCFSASPDFAEPRFANVLSLWGAGALRRRLDRGVGLEPRIDAARIVLEDLLAVGVADRGLVDIALGVVEAEAGPRVVALHRADHFRGEQDVVDRYHFGEQIDARLVIDAGVEIDVVAHDLAKLRLAVVEGDAAEAAPM